MFFFETKMAPRNDVHNIFGACLALQAPHWSMILTPNFSHWPHHGELQTYPALRVAEVG